MKLNIELWDKCVSKALDETGFKEPEISELIIDGKEYIVIEEKAYEMQRYLFKRTVEIYLGEIK